jgi:hypothetical protein
MPGAGVVEVLEQLGWATDVAQAAVGMAEVKVKRIREALAAEPKGFHRFEFQELLVLPVELLLTDAELEKVRIEEAP